MLMGFFCIIILLISYWIFQSTFVIVSVENHSMLPTLSAGDRVLVFRRWIKYVLRKNQIVVFQYDFSATTTVNSTREKSDGSSASPNPLFIKRVVAIENEVIEDFVIGLDESTPKHIHVQPGQTVPRNHCFVCGDNRSQSIDSRHWGAISCDQVWGIVLMRLSHSTSQESTAVSRDQHAEMLTEKTLIGQSIDQLTPSFTARNLQGEIVTFDLFRGRTVVFIFIATHLVTCRDVTVAYSAAYPEFIRAGIEIAIISISSDIETSKWINKFQLNLPVFISSDAANPFQGNPQFYFALPFLLVLGPQGHIYAHGYATSDYYALLEHLSQRSGSLQS
jgi:signal peptidase I